MSHLSQDELVLLHYGDRTPTDAVREHLETCTHCRAEQAALASLLEAIEPPPVPERDAAYADRVYRQVTARISQPSRPTRTLSFWVTWPRFAAAAAALVLAVLAFWAGREQGRTEIALSPEQRERILLLAVSEHLERSERMLRDLVNTQQTATTDLGQGPQTAERLAADNRIYRATAVHAGQADLAQLLDELERVLVEIANTPTTVSGPEFNALWRRIQANGLLIKMRIAESETRHDIQNQI
jgi:hypothetical protein